jgi:hypothetical protein
MLVPLIALSLVAAPMGAEAKKKKRKKSKAQKLYKKAVNAAKVGNYQEAISYFEESRARGAPPVTLFNIGKCYEAMGQFYVAVDYYEEYLTFPKAKKIKKIKKRMEELRIKPSEVTFDTIPIGCEVHKEHDDKTTKKIGVTPLQITLEAGDHTYYVIKEGYKRKRVKIEAGYGMPFNLEITMTPSGEEEAAPVEPEPETKKKEYKPVGVYMEIGGGVALYPYTYVGYTRLDSSGSEEDHKVGFMVGGDASFGIGWNHKHGVNTGFALGARAGFRPLSVDTWNRTDDEEATFTSMFATLLLVPAFQVNVHERLALEFSLPLGIAWFVPHGDIDRDTKVFLVDGYIEGGNLLLLDLGVGAGLKVMLVRGLYMTIEPVRLQALFPLSGWHNKTKALVDLDMGIRLGYEF